MMPAWNYVQRENPTEVDHLSESETKSIKHTFIWAWIDEHEAHPGADVCAGLGHPGR